MRKCGEYRLKKEKEKKSEKKRLQTHERELGVQGLNGSTYCWREGRKEGWKGRKKKGREQGRKGGRGGRERDDKQC